eukprot:COSAG01_NODE_3593_length_5898_cov_5.089310_9_plen_269_part_00
MWSGDEGSGSSEDDGLDVASLTDEEYVTQAGVEELIDAVHAAIVRRQPRADALVDLVSELLEHGAPLADLELAAVGERRRASVVSLEQPDAARAGSGGDIDTSRALLSEHDRYVAGVEAALVAAVRVLVEERPYMGDVAPFLANQFRVAAARLGPPPPPPPLTPPPSPARQTADVHVLLTEPEPEPEAEPEPAPEPAPEREQEELPSSGLETPLGAGAASPSLLVGYTPGAGLFVGGGTSQQQVGASLRVGAIGNKLEPLMLPPGAIS